MAMQLYSVKEAFVTSALELPGYEIVENIGVVRGIVVRSNNLFGSLFGGLRSLLGGNIEVFSRMCDEARSHAFQEMIRHASERGANAVVGFRYDATELSAGITEVLAYGTAVKVVPRRTGIGA